MNRMLACTLTASLVALPISATHAEVSVSTDRSHYELGEVVHISIHNSGPENLYFVSYPFAVAFETTTPLCVYGCVGLPVVTEFPAGSTQQENWDTGLGEVPPGEYWIGTTISNENASATIHLHEKLGPEAPAWSTLKAQYR